MARRSWTSRVASNGEAVRTNRWSGALAKLAAGASVATRTLEDATGARHTFDLAVIVLAFEGAVAAGIAVAGAIGTLTAAVRVSTVARHVTRARRTREIATRTQCALTGTVGACGYTVAIWVACGVTRRCGTGEVTTAIGSAFAIAVGALAGTMGVVSCAQRRAGRCIADERAISTPAAHAVPREAIRWIIVATTEQAGQCHRYREVSSRGKAKPAANIGCHARIMHDSIAAASARDYFAP